MNLMVPQSDAYLLQSDACSPARRGGQNRNWVKNLGGVRAGIDPRSYLYSCSNTSRPRSRASFKTVLREMRPTAERFGSRATLGRSSSARFAILAWTRNTSCTDARSVPFTIGPLTTLACIRNTSELMSKAAVMHYISIAFR